jgi:hypothetical protein
MRAFLEISFALLKSEKPFSVRCVSSLLKTQNKAFGFQTHAGKVKAPLLSDAVTSQFGREWLGTVLPPLAKKQEGTILSQMDGVLYLKNSASSVTVYILALSLLLCCMPVWGVSFIQLRRICAVLYSRQQLP